MKEKKHNKQQIEQIYSLKVIIISLLISTAIFSCKNEPHTEEKIIKKTAKNNFLPVTVDFEFPDTVYINKLYDGKIKYWSVLDTITTSFDDPQKIRYISFYMTKTQSINYEDEDLYKVKLDTFGALDHNTIPFYDIKFSELGVHYIDGLINDHVIIDTLPKIRNPDDKVRYIEKVVRATHKVVVIDKPNNK